MFNIFLETDPFIQRSQLVESAIQLSIDMFILISKRFTYLLSNYYQKNKQNFLLDETEPEENKTWRQLFPSIKIFIDWMLCNSKLWQPLPDQVRIKCFFRKFIKVGLLNYSIIQCLFSCRLIWALT